MSRGKYTGKTFFSPEHLSEVAERIAGLIPSRGQSAFARQIGITPQHLNNILKTRSKPTLEIIASIASTQGVSFDWLLTGEEDMNVHEAQPSYGGPIDLPPNMRKAIHDLAHAAGIASQNDAPTLIQFLDRKALPRFDPDEYAFLPLLVDSAAAGNPREIKDDDVEEWCIVHRNAVRHPGATACIRIKGSSMEPLLPDRSIVAVDHSRSDPDALLGKIVAAYHEEGVTIKRLFYDNNGPILVSENRAYKPKRLDQDTDRIIGAVEWAWIHFD